MQRNRLAAESSPYLRQHADNPVEWYPWGDEALDLAKTDDKPILLSIGYSACHWCHVMAHESFEDAGIAMLMNRWFVNIKVDREERPDLDKIYQIAQQLITQRNGGWPLTMFLTPDDRYPFFGGTYFPKDPRHGLPGFGEVLRRVAEYHRGHAAEIRHQNGELARAFLELSPAQAPADLVLDDAPLSAARRALETHFDSHYGGFGKAPKFPQSPGVERSLRHWYASSAGPAPDLKALYIATLSLTRMAEGGLFDQLGGGFFRYSVDDSWTIPHFEKMLYDNGQLLALYAWAALATGEPLFRNVAEETADWLLREMGSPDGAFFASLDADSEGAEGRFYVWSRTEVAGLLTPERYAEFAKVYGLDRAPNFDGLWHLHICEPAGPALASARSSLLAARNRRARPARDDKVLASWNALAIKGLCIAARVLERPDLTAAAAGAVDFIRSTQWQHGRLLATATDGRARLPAFLDDYAFLADALLELLQNRWRTSDLAFALLLADELLARFEDDRAGGFFFTASDHERLIHRTKTFGDDSLPSGNGIAASVLCRLGYLVGNLDYIRAAERTLMAASTDMTLNPLGHMSLLNALEDFLTSTQIVIIRGDPTESQDWARRLLALYSPSRLVFAIPADAEGLPAALADKRAGSATTAYVCAGMTCSAPMRDLDELARKLAAHVA